MSGDAFVLMRAAVDVNYAGAGVLYWDFSGRVQRDLLQQLGSPPFRIEAAGAAPNATVLRSPTERLQLEFNYEHFVANQFAAETIARFEHVAPTAWSEVYRWLELTARIRRVGVRFWLMWPGESEEEVEHRLLNTGLIQDAPRCAEVFGHPRTRALTCTVGTPENQTRYALSSGSAALEVEGGSNLPKNLEKFNIKHGMLLDVDASRVYPAGASVSKSDLRNMLRDSWTQARTTARKIQGLLT